MQSEGIDWKLSVMCFNELEKSQGDLWSTCRQRWKLTALGNKWGAFE